jgi:hypothetical protein
MIVTAVHWQDTTTAIGTAAAALVAALGFVATIWITRSDRVRDNTKRQQDRRDADERLAAERAAGALRIQDERAHASAEATRQFQVETLVKASRPMGT